MPTNKWATPQYVFDYLNGRFGKFTLDPAAAVDTAKCARWYGETDNGLAWDWDGVVFVNPPYDNIAPWVEKAAREVGYGQPLTGLGRAERVVMLLPARTGRAWWMRVLQCAAEVYFVQGRISFELPGKDNNSFEDSVVVVFDRVFDELKFDIMIIPKVKQERLL